MGEWQPIETAPKDGRFVLLYFPENDEAKTGFWSDETIGDTLPEDAGWYDWEGASNSMNELYGAPTHWVPLPSPPSGK